LGQKDLTIHDVIGLTCDAVKSKSDQTPWFAGDNSADHVKLSDQHPGFEEKLGLYYRGMPDKAIAVLKKALAKHQRIFSVSVAYDRYAISTNKTIYYNNLYEDLDEALINAHPEPVAIYFGSSGQWLLTFNNKTFLTSANIPKFTTEIKRIYQSGNSVDYATFSEDSWCVSYNKNHFTYLTMPDGLLEGLRNIQQAGGTVRSFAMNQKNWVIVGGQEQFAVSDHAPEELTRTLYRIRSYNHKIGCVAMTLRDGWLVIDEGTQ
jgi:hypothetical protein